MICAVIQDIGQIASRKGWICDSAVGSFGEYYTAGESVIHVVKYRWRLLRLDGYGQRRDPWDVRDKA
jgi:hypothetical protein